MMPWSKQIAAKYHWFHSNLQTCFIEIKSIDNFTKRLWVYIFICLCDRDSWVGEEHQVVNSVVTMCADFFLLYYSRACA